MPYRVFISHSSIDMYVARKLREDIEAQGASTFLDETDIEHGDDFEEQILAAEPECDELAVLLTPWALDRPFVWLEVGFFRHARKRIVGILYGLSPADLSADNRMPVTITRLDLVELNKIESYLLQISRRAKKKGP